MAVTERTILLVEDDSNDVLLLERAVRKANLPLTLREVSDGELAMQYLSGEGAYADRARFPWPDLVLLDLKLPKRSGFEVLEWIRAQQACKRLPVAVLSSSRHHRDIDRAYDAGANSFLVKPVGFDTLLEMVTLLYRYWFGLNQSPSDLEHNLTNTDPTTSLAGIL
jgi:DNA-binding response OmpR family regulator